MAESPRFTVPRRNVPALKALAMLDQDSFGHLLDAIKREHPVNSITSLQAIFETDGNLSEPEARRLVIALIGLYNLHTLHSWDLSLVIDVATESPDLALEPEAAERLGGYMRRVLEQTDFQLIAKAIDVAGQHANSLHATRIITDIRPVFPETESTTIEAGIVSQTLVIRYFDDSGKERTFFVKISDEQLQDLQGQIVRAVEKAAAVDRLFLSADVRMIHGEG